jgi:hypothetical protein
MPQSELAPRDVASVPAAQILSAAQTPSYDFNDDNVIAGGAYWALLAERYLRD